MTFINRHYDEGRHILNAEALRDQIQDMPHFGPLGGAEVELVYSGGTLRWAGIWVGGWVTAWVAGPIARLQGDVGCTKSVFSVSLAVQYQWCLTTTAAWSLPDLVVLL